MSPCQDFSRFPDLPTEIRLKIWPLTFPSSRVIEIRTADYPSNISYLPIPSRPGNTVSDINWVTKTRPPAALSVCRETRAEALRVYSVRFELLAAGGEVIYINPDIDILYANFKFQDLMQLFLRDLRMFTGNGPDDELLALAFNEQLLHFWNDQVKDPTRKQIRYKSLTLIYEPGIMEPYWTEWDGDCVLGELSELSKAYLSEKGFLQTMEDAESGMHINSVEIHRGETARAHMDATRTTGLVIGKFNTLQE